MPKTQSTTDKEELKMLRDKERILMTIISEVFRTYGLQTHRMTFSEGDRRIDLHCDDVKKGDLVVSTTSGIHPWTVGFAASDYDRNTGTLKVQEIGSSRICNISNESFMRISGIRPELLRLYDQNEFELKVKKAYKKLKTYWHRYRGVEFDGDSARIAIDEAFGGMDIDTKPYFITLPWSTKTTIKAIAQAMREQGYGEREFEIDWESFKRSCQKALENMVFCALHRQRKPETTYAHQEKHCRDCYYLEHFGDIVQCSSDLVAKDRFQHQCLVDAEHEGRKYQAHLFKNIDMEPKNAQA